MQLVIRTHAPGKTVFLIYVLLRRLMLGLIIYNDRKKHAHKYFRWLGLFRSIESTLRALQEHQIYVWLDLLIFTQLSSSILRMLTAAVIQRRIWIIWMTGPSHGSRNDHKCPWARSRRIVILPNASPICSSCCAQARVDSQCINMDPPDPSVYRTNYGIRRTPNGPGRRLTPTLSKLVTIVDCGK